MRSALPALLSLALWSPAALAQEADCAEATAQGAACVPNAPAAEPCVDPLPEGMSCIPGGAFWRGDDSVPAATPKAAVWLQTFYMDQNEVTTEAYKSCVQRGKCKKAGPKYSDFSRPKQPINGVSWYDAVQYCEAQGKHLPTEAQWEKAARGTDGRTYPWGDEPATCERAVIKTAAGRSCGVQKRGKQPEKGRTFEVGQKPAAIYGLYDMAGNSYEWVYDWASTSYTACGAACEGIDPKGPCEGREPCAKHHKRSVRGGSWYWEADHARTFWRRSHIPKNDPYFHHFGFRCAASGAEAAQLSAKVKAAAPQ